LFDLLVDCFPRATTQDHPCHALDLPNLHAAIAKSQQDRSERDYIRVVETVFTGAFVLPLGGWHCLYGGQVAQPSPPSADLLWRWRHATFDKLRDRDEVLVHDPHPSKAHDAPLSTALSIVRIKHTMCDIVAKMPQSAKFAGKFAAVTYPD
jgi:hypothetical protein